MQARQFTVKGQTFESSLTDAEAITVCRGLTRSSFAQDLVRQNDSRRGRRLSGTQWAWVHKLATDQQRPRANAVALASDVQPILDLFQVAQGRLKNPVIHLQTLSGLSVRLSIAGPRSRLPGTVNVTSDGKFDERVWYGRIRLDGTFEPSRDCTQAVTDYLVEFAADPATIAALDGKRTGRCCFCNIRLTDERSLFVGYGPICADNYNLPWGHMS